jgi:pantoate--beta-alanine ligase
MVIFKNVADLRPYLSRLGPLGFVPTMGALHEGHASLIREAKKGGRPTVVSIFVNPTQFNDPGDFAKYPKTLEADILLLERLGVDVLFLPSVPEIYPVPPTEHYELGYLETILEGKYRPGHFQGVCQVMDRLLRIVEPADLYMGQKDYQQCLVVKKLITEMGLDIHFNMCPILREPDGLAMSSRNMRLTPEERLGATALYATLLAVKKGMSPSAAALALEEKGFRVDYVEVADAQTLLPLDGHSPSVILVAAFTGDVRLIDNIS